jgi:molybdopterin molybdotransferase
VAGVSGEHDVGLDQARRIIAEHVIAMEPEDVALADAVGRRLAETVRARADHPSFTNSSMDGWAVAAQATPGRLQVVGESAAGVPYVGRLAGGAAIVISTGAPLPDGADAVVPREQAVQVGETLEVAQAVPPGAYVRRRGDDLRAGDTVLPRGLRLAPHHLAAAAGAGYPALVCDRRPRVALIVSGHELIPVGQDPGPGQVWDIASVVMPALIRQAGGEVVVVGTVDDERKATEDALSVALGAADLVVTTGGISVGDHDHFRPALARRGVEELFWGVRIRPGHPTWFGRLGDARVLGLPGNPVASVVCFWVFGRAVLGCAEAWTTLPLAVDYTSPTQRADLIRATLGPQGLVPASRQASHHVTSLADATHIAVVPEGGGQLRRGARLAAVPLAG